MDLKSILLLLLGAASSHGNKLQDARRWYERGREAMAKCHPQHGAGDARENCAPLLVDDVLTPDDADALVAAAEASGAYRRPNPAHRTEELPAFLVEEAGLPTREEAWEMVNAFFNCPDPKEQPEFLYRRGSLVKVSENCVAADATVARLISFAACRVTDRSDKEYDPGKELIGF